MAEKNYAFIKDGFIVNIAVFDNPSNDLLLRFKDEFELDLIIVATENATVGGTYDGQKFWFPQPYPSWIKDELTNQWVAPKPAPEPTGLIYYKWDEDTLEWVEVTLPTE